MAKLDITNEIELEIKKNLSTVKSYSNLTSAQKEKIIELLINCSNSFCPFTGVLYAKWPFTIEHFHTRQAQDMAQNVDFSNLYPCASGANLPTVQNPLTLDPKLVDYVDKLYIDTTDFLVKPKDENDANAKATIQQYGLNRQNKLSSYRATIYAEIHIEKTNTAKKYSFSEYF